ncbi:hypothetical protein NDU88_003940 [Pleurodeles waltl]|uniref:Uncharacterized protein n=1 Tax=Pleurodeles waltl TaxID=8319 RepID=A0AAV7V1I4_PLEWA|nr:hypothetical protein NDU88_003940 [Pleurodeles waltl]
MGSVQSCTPRIQNQNGILYYRELYSLEEDIWRHEWMLSTDPTAAAPLAEAKLARRSTLERVGILDYRDYLIGKHVKGDKVGKLLAWLLHSNSHRTPFTAIRDEKGLWLNFQDMINTAFRSYYANLYAVRQTLEPTLIGPFLDNILPQLQESQQVDLEVPLSEAEISNAFKQMARGKSSVVDSWPVEFYSTFNSRLTLHLLKVFNSAYS